MQREDKLITGNRLRGAIALKVIVDIILCIYFANRAMEIESDIVMICASIFGFLAGAGVWMLLEGRKRR